MNILFMLFGVLIVYIGINLLYRKKWTEGFKVLVEFEKDHVVKGDSVNLMEVITNDKKLPLPCINLKFQVDRDLEFSHSDTNSSVSDMCYRNDVFSILSNQRITRRVPVVCKRRGVFFIQKLETTFAGVFMNEINVLKQNANCHITVFPKAADTKRLMPNYISVANEVERKKYLQEDPFVFRGIRDYDSHDSMKNINWKAFAKTGDLMVNEFNESMSRNVCILLNLEPVGALSDDYVCEESISIASGLAQMFIEQGISVSMISNGCDYESKEQTMILSGAGILHLNLVNSALARIDLKLSMEEFADVLERVIIKENRYVDSSTVYVIVSSNTRKRLQEVVSNVVSGQKDTVWIVPHLPGMETELKYCDIKPTEWEIC